MFYIFPIFFSLFFFLNSESQKTFKVNEKGYIENFDQFLLNSDKQKVFTFKTKIDGSVINSLVYLPEEYSNNGDLRYPLLLFLHGSAESGNDLEKVKRHGPPKLIAAGKSFPFIVVSPQLPGHFSSKWPPELVDEIYEVIKKNFRVNVNKFYLTGVSAGGAGTWKYAIMYPEKVAAIAPVCGWGDPPKACDMKNVPTWAFHGAKDKVINPIASRNMINALKNCGATPKFSLYPNAGHQAWKITYNDPELYKWLLSHSKKKPLPNEKEKLIEKKSTISNLKNNQQSKGTIIKISPLTPLPVSLKESSGLVIMGANSFWTHNDSGNAPVLFNIDSTGFIKKIKRVTNATNLDWEDITIDKEDNFYIGDIGNNKNNRKSFQIYKIPNPELIPEERIRAEAIVFSFPDQKQFPPSPSNKNFDIEAMVCYNDSLYLFSKNHTIPYNGYCKLYRLPNAAGNYIAELMDSVFLGSSFFESSVTSAALSKDNKHLVLLSYSKIFIFSCFKNSDFFSGNRSDFLFPYLSQREAIAFSNEGIYITDEKFHGIGGNLYLINTSTSLKEVSCP